MTFNSQQKQQQQKSKVKNALNEFFFTFLHTFSARFLRLHTYLSLCDLFLKLYFGPIEFKRNIKHKKEQTLVCACAVTISLSEIAEFIPYKNIHLVQFPMFSAIFFHLLYLFWRIVSFVCTHHTCTPIFCLLLPVNNAGL